MPRVELESQHRATTGDAQLNDPHVDELRYHIETADDLVFRDPPPIGDETGAFRMALAEGVATFEMKEHHPSAETARIPVEEYLRTWEIDLALQRGRTSLWFVFDGAQVIDRDPPPSPPPGTPITREVTDAQGISDSVRPSLTKGEYPTPPENFVADVDTRAMWEQYERYLQGRDRLLPMAYSCLSRLEFKARFHPVKGKRQKAASMYRIDYEVLDKLGELTNKLGDEVGARKLSSQSELRPPNPQEIAWTEATLRRIIRRAGEYAADPQKQWSQITMSDLPRL